MKKINFKISLAVWILVLLIQSFIPSFIYRNIYIQPDLILIMVSIVSLRFGGDFAVIFGFTNGLIQDFITQESLLGILALCKSFTAYSLYFLQKYQLIWARYLKLIYIFIIFLFHNFLYYYFFLSGNFSIITLGLFVILLQTIIAFFLFIIFEKILFKSKLI